MVFYITLKMSQLRVFLPRLTVALKASVTLVLLLISFFYTRAQSDSTRALCTRVQCNDTLAYHFGLSTNLPYDLTYIPGYGLTSIPSLSLEIYPSRGRWTFGADIEWPMWRHYDSHRYFQINSITAWSRCYFKERKINDRFRGWYGLANISAARYGIGFNESSGWQGEGLATSLGIGYKWALGRHFSIDMGLALGVFYSAYDPYVWGNDATGWYYYDYGGDPEAFRKRNQRFFWAGPTRLYINIGFDFWSRKRDRRPDRQ